MPVKETKVVFSVLTVNHPGVLLRVTGLFSRRGFNIDSIVACSTEKPEFSRWTLVVTGDEATFTQLLRQLLKLEDVVKVGDIITVKYLGLDEKGRMNLSRKATLPGYEESEEHKSGKGSDRGSRNGDRAPRSNGNGSRAGRNGTDRGSRSGGNSRDGRSERAPKESRYERTPRNETPKAEEVKLEEKPAEPKVEPKVEPKAETAAEESKEKKGFFSSLFGGKN